MSFEAKTVVITGAASGIGAALARRFDAAGATVCVLDRASFPADISKRYHCQKCDVTDETELAAALQEIESRVGPIDIYVSNAGVLSQQPGHAASACDADWTRCWSVNVMAQVFAARVLIPLMAARGSGYFVTVASAAGLLNQIGDAAYSASKHAAVSFAESLAITHTGDGIDVSVVCPQYVATPLLNLAHDAADRESLMTADEVALCILTAMEQRRFLVLPHPDVQRYFQARSRDHDAWIKGMIKLRMQVITRFGAARPQEMYRLV